MTSDTEAPVSRQARPLARLLVESVLDVKGPLPSGLEFVSLPEAVDAAEQHRISPAVQRRLRLQHAPEGWQTAFDSLRLQQVMRHMRTQAELKTIGAALDDAGIDWLVGKGPVAADTIWPQTDMREYFDVDLFVSSTRFEDAIDVLLDAGCSLVDRNWRELAHTMRAEIALIGPLGTPIDLHWHIAVPSELRRTFCVDMNAMIARARTVSLGTGLQVRTFDEIDTVLHLAFHAAQAGANKLMWAGDIHYALQDPRFDADVFWARARDARVTRPVSMVLERVDAALGTASLSDAYEGLDTGGAWGRVVRRAQRSRPFPSLPSDPHAGGNAVGGVRPTTIGSAVATIRSAVVVRLTERRVDRSGPEERTLHRDVLDTDARRRYFATVQNQGRST
jgi:hypothetical protein